MNLGDLWTWERRKLGCRIRAETQNPALDEIRERLGNMTGTGTLSDKPLPDMAGKKGLVAQDTAPLICNNGESAMALSMASLMAYQRDANPKAISRTRKNIYKKFFQVPRSPPAKVMLDLQKDRLRLPLSSVVHQSWELKKGSMRSRHGFQHAAKRQTKPHSLDETTRPPDRKCVNGTTDSKEQVFPPYSGDLFMTRGVYMGGIIYQSRLGDLAGSDAHRRNVLNHEAPSLKQKRVTDPRCSQREAQAKLSHLAQSNSAPKMQEAKLHCANSLAIWSTYSENAVRLSEEGAISAIIVLSKDECAEVRRASATAFKNMSYHSELCRQMVKKSAVPTISELGVAGKEFVVSRDCALALVNLTSMDGIEAKLVEDGIVIALMSIMNQHEELAELCSRGLFNLTCVDQPYIYMERVIKAFVSLASSTIAVVKHVCAAAFCNLSDMKTIRSRIVEEGVIQVVGVLARGAEAKTRRVCAIVLHSIASTRACRVDMVSKGAVQVLYALSSDVDTVTLHYVASAIIRLTIEQQNLPRLVHEGGVTALCNICLRCPREDSTTQLCASALNLLSRQAIGRQAIVQEGCVPALVTLLHEASDSSTLRHGLSAVTNVLIDEINHGQLLGQGGIAAVINLCSHECSQIRESCAQALFNFSRGKAARERGVSASAIPAIIALSKLPEPRTRMRCAATLCKLASVEANVSLMVEEGVVPAFIDMMQTRDPDVVKHCCAALCRLAHEGSSAVTIAEGAVPHVIAGCGEAFDAATRQSCCAVLSAVSAHESCCRPLSAMGTLEALIALVEDRTTDNTTRLRCAVAFANLSNEPTIQGDMVAGGIVPVIGELSNSYCENNQLYCARTLCNLGHHRGSEGAIVKQGGVASLMMICMVRSVSHFTKQVCAKALSNLLCVSSETESWLLRLANEGLVQAVSVLSRLPEEETMSICASIFCFMSACGPLGRSLLIDRTSTLKDVFGLMRASNKATLVTCGKAACNLVGHADSQPAAIRAGVVLVLKTLSGLGDPIAETAAADSYFLITGDSYSRREMIELDVLPVLIKNARSLSTATQTSCCRVLMNLAWEPSARVPLLNANIMSMLVDVVEQTCGSKPVDGDNCRSLSTQNENFMIQHLVLRVFTYMSFMSKEHRVLMVHNDLIPTLELLYSTLNLSDSPNQSSCARRLTAVSIRSLAAVTGAQNKLVNDGIGRLLCDIIGAESENSADPGTQEHCARAIYSIAREKHLNAALVDQGILKTMPILGKFSDCYAITASILHVLCLDASLRELIAVDLPVRNVLVQLFEAPEDPHASSTVQSCAQTFLLLSRCTARAREELTSAGLVPLLIRMSRHRDEKVATSCSEALKSLSSEGSSGIEEGTVLTLISMSLSGSGTTDCSVPDASLLTVIPEHPIVEGDYRPSDELTSKCMADCLPHTISITKVLGGSAGGGPPPPEPPDMDINDNPNLPVPKLTELLEEEHNIGASMMFAKMTTEALGLCILPKC